MQREDYGGVDEKILIARIQQGDAGAMDFILDKYKNFVRNKVQTLYIIGGERDDLIQEGMIGLYKAIRDYQPDKEAQFSTFAGICITRQMYNAINASNTRKNQPLNQYMSIDNEENREGLRSESSLFDEAVTHKPNDNPEEMMIDREYTSFLEQKLLESLSRNEKQVYFLIKEDIGYQKIANLLGREPKAIDNTIQRIKRKMRVILEKI